jgi:hypothetical protein
VQRLRDIDTRFFVNVVDTLASISYREDAACVTIVEPFGIHAIGTYYRAAIHAKGGATIRLVASDSNCSMSKNCGPMVNDGNTCAQPIVLTNIDATARARNPSFPFDTAYNGQWLAMVVTSVTSP